MRPINFRAWDKYKKWMVYDVQDAYDGLWSERNSDEINDYYNYSIYHDFTDEENFNFMQSTGLKDKNDVEIYEGGYSGANVPFNEECGETHTGEVVYDKDYARYVISRPQKYIEPKTEDLRNTLSDRSTYEIIGNIHENPELIKEAQ